MHSNSQNTLRCVKTWKTLPKICTVQQKELYWAKLVQRTKKNCKVNKNRFVMHKKLVL